MPHSASAKKRLRQNVRSRDRNKAIKTEIKTSIKKVLQALSAKDVTTAQDLLRLSLKKLIGRLHQKQFIKIRLRESSQDSLPVLSKQLRQQLAENKVTTCFLYRSKASLYNVPLNCLTVEDRSFDTGSLVVPVALLIEYWCNAAKADSNATCHWCF